jgi:hypothetical protein
MQGSFTFVGSVVKRETPKTVAFSLVRKVPIPAITYRTRKQSLASAKILEIVHFYIHLFFEFICLHFTDGIRLADSRGRRLHYRSFRLDSTPSKCQAYSTCARPGIRYIDGTVRLFQTYHNELERQQD